MITKKTKVITIHHDGVTIECPFCYEATKLTSDLKLRYPPVKCEGCNAEGNYTLISRFIAEQRVVPVDPNEGADWLDPIDKSYD